MPKFNEVLSGEEKYVLSKSIRMMDIMRGVYYSDADSWMKYEGKGVVTQHIFGDKVRLVHCYNYNKYIEFSRDGIKLYIVIIDDEPIGIAFLNNFVVCKFIPNEKYECWDENKLCEILNMELEGTTFKYSSLSDSDKRLWVQKYNEVIFKMHLKFDDSFIAELWRKMNVPLRKQQLMEYRDAIYEKRANISFVQKETIAQEIIFYILPRYISKCSDEEHALISELCRFVIEEYKILIEREWDAGQVLSQLEEQFLINSIEKAKEYYIANNCSVERYKDCCMDVSYKKIMDSFEQWDISSCQKLWVYEAIDRLFRYESTEKDWIVERILDLIVLVDVRTDVLVQLKEYISLHIDEIYVRETIIFHLQQIMSNSMNGCLVPKLLEECCDILQGFESRELSLEEKETLRKAQNSKELSNEKFNYINKKKSVVVIPDSTRIRPARDMYDPRYEWSPSGKEPRIFSVWDAEGLVGKLEVVEHSIIWNMIGEDREKLFRLFSEYVRNLEMIPQEREIRYATKEEAEYWEEKTILSCIGNKNFFEVHCEWFVCSKQVLDVRLMKDILEELKYYEEIAWMHNRILVALIFFVLPNVEKNPELCTQQELKLIGEFLQKVTNIKIQENDILSCMTASELIACYYNSCCVNSLVKAKKMYLYFNCKKSQYSNGKILHYRSLWEEFKRFDVSDYENEWRQEVFEKEIGKKKNKFALSSCFILDLLETVGTLNNYQRFISVYENYWNKKYILFRLERTMQHVTQEKVQHLLEEFCEKLRKEIKVDEEN